MKIDGKQKKRKKTLHTFLLKKNHNSLKGFLRQEFISCYGFDYYREKNLHYDIESKFRSYSISKY